MRNKEEVSCFNCRYYLGREYICMKLWRCRSVKNETITAKKCDDFVRGTYDPDLIESEC